MENTNSKFLDKLKKIGLIALTIFAVVAFLAVAYFGVDFLFKNILSDTQRAVLSNFIVFASVIALVMVKVVKPNQMLEVAQEEIENKIKTSEATKEESQERLTSLQESLENIATQIEAIFTQSDKNANQVGERIIEDAHKTAQSIQNDTEKTIENNQSLLKNDLVKRTSNAVIEIARNQIIKELNTNPDLHNKLIEESIEAMALNIKIEEE